VICVCLFFLLPSMFSQPRYNCSRRVCVCVCSLPCRILLALTVTFQPFLRTSLLSFFAPFFTHSHKSISPYTFLLLFFSLTQEKFHPPKMYFRDKFTLKAYFIFPSTFHLSAERGRNKSLSLSTEMVWCASGQASSDREPKSDTVRWRNIYIYNI
jgi:hypothetical protein